MKGRLIALDHLHGAPAAALLVDGRLQDLILSSAGPAPGTIYRAIADRPVKGQGGMFLKTPDGPVFFRQAKGISPGDALLVQVTGYAEPGKAVPVTAKLLFKSRYAIITPQAPGRNVSRQIRDDDVRDQLLEIAHEMMADSAHGLILRSSAEEADPGDVAEDIAEMLTLADQVLGDGGQGAARLHDGDGPHVLAWREWTEPAQVETADGSFEDYGVLDQLADLGQGIALDGGGRMYVEPTRALTAVDVNTGGDTSPAAALKANLSAVRELPRALRLLGLGGQVVVDFAPLAKKDRRTVENALRAALRADPVETALVGWTPLGHYELQRKRERAQLPGEFL